MEAIHSNKYPNKQKQEAYLELHFLKYPYILYHNKQVHLLSAASNYC